MIADACYIACNRFMMNDLVGFIMEQANLLFISQRAGKRRNSDYDVGFLI